MKKIAIVIITMVGFIVFGTQSANAQEKKVNQQKVYKTSIQQSPSKVQEALKKYSNYKISKVVTYTKTGSSDENIYKFKVTKGIFSHFLLINEEGKVVAIETGEPSK